MKKHKGVNWSVAGKNMGLPGVFYSFGQKRKDSWVYFVPVPGGGERAERLAEYIRKGGRSLTIDGYIFDLQSPQFRHKRVS